MKINLEIDEYDNFVDRESDDYPGKTEQSHNMTGQEIGAPSHNCSQEHSLNEISPGQYIVKQDQKNKIDIDMQLIQEKIEENLQHHQGDCEKNPDILLIHGS